ncbi:uncharacterized protein TNCV_1372231 [Trichonephila clavipes]|nr:uncharacterized protein TNCV_1372231 [Trichonephila clavipes]
MSSAKVLCGVMNLPTPLQRFNKKESGLDTAAETVATVSMQIAAKEAKDVSGHSDIAVAIDGTWQKHGHTSLNGAVIATSFYTGKVLDASILSRFCKCPNKMHNENCILEIVEVWKFQEPSKSSNSLKFCMVCDIPNFWEMVTTKRIKQLTRCSHMEIQVLKNWNVLAMSRSA